MPVQWTGPDLHPRQRHMHCERQAYCSLLNFTEVQLPQVELYAVLT